MKISVIYHSLTGNTQRIAALIAQGAGSHAGVEAKSMSIDDPDGVFIENSKAIIIGCPTHRGALTWQMKKWLETSRLKLAGRIGAVFATCKYIGGGGDFVEMELIAHLLVLGMLVYSGGTSCGQPFTHYGAIAIQDGDEAQKDRAVRLGERIAAKALELFGNQ